VDLRVAVGNDSVQHNLMQIRRLQQQHLINARPANLIRNLLNLRVRLVGAPKGRADELLAVPVQQVIRLLVRARRDLDELGEAVADLRDGEGAQEGEVEEGGGGCVVGAEAVLVVAVVDSDFDGDGGVDEADDGGGDADEVCVAAVGGAGKAGTGLVVVLGGRIGGERTQQRR
jgi:hypothetical protein